MHSSNDLKTVAYALFLLAVVLYLLMPMIAWLKARPCPRCIKSFKLSLRRKKVYGDPFVSKQDERSIQQNICEQEVCSTCAHVFSVTYIPHKFEGKIRSASA